MVSHEVSNRAGFVQLPASCVVGDQVLIVVLTLTGGMCVFLYNFRG
jgi:hypothetical protein